jgi:hypothetical protein
MLKTWANYFDKTMVLLFETEKLVLWKWSGGWVKTLTAGQEIPLDTPSIFRIVVDTGHSYHGYIRPSPVNERFFKDVNGGQFPEHVTVCPLIIGDTFAGMILGTTTKDVGIGLRLVQLEEQAKKFSDVLAALEQSMPKAS